MATLLTIDDDARVRDAVRVLFADSTRHRVIGEASTLEAARAQIRLLQPEILLLDLGLPDGRGTDLLRELRAEKPGVLALILTVFDDDDHIFEALRAGAVGYILKDELFTKLPTALEELVGGGSPMSPTVARRVLSSFRHVGAATAEDDLTDREREVLQFLAQGSTYDEIGRMLKISTNTVRSHVRSTYDKLHVCSKTEATLEGIRRGIIRGR
jgi:DNA-binding NarL/FixJ family response regulator